MVDQGETWYQVMVACVPTRQEETLCTGATLAFGDDSPFSHMAVEHIWGHQLMPLFLHFAYLVPAYLHEDLAVLGWLVKRLRFVHGAFSSHNPLVLFFPRILRCITKGPYCTAMRYWRAWQVWFSQRTASMVARSSSVLAHDRGSIAKLNFVCSTHKIARLCPLPLVLNLCRLLLSDHESSSGPSPLLVTRSNSKSIAASPTLVEVFNLHIYYSPDLTFFQTCPTPHPRRDLCRVALLGQMREEQTRPDQTRRREFKRFGRRLLISRMSHKANERIAMSRTVRVELLDRSQAGWLLLRQ